MPRFATVAVSVLAGLTHAAETESKARGPNPVRKVIRLLSAMSDKVEEEGNKAKAAYDEFMCYCKNGAVALATSVEEAEKNLPQLESALKETVAAHTQIGEEIKAAKADIKECKEAVGSAESIRAAQTKTFAQDSANLATNMASVDKAIAALSKGASSAFLQTSSATVLKDVTVNMDMSNTDRNILASFLTGADSAPASGEILGILKQMHDEMKEDLAGMKATEESQLGGHNNMLAAKAKEINSLTKAVETKTGRLGEKAVDIANLKNEVEDTSDQLAVDKKFLADLDTNCETKKKEWGVYEKMHKDELLALSETIKILNDDDAGEIFKKTAPDGGAASFLQVSQKQRAKAAARILKKGGKHHHNKMNLLALALKGKNSKGFAGVIATIDKLKAMMNEEQIMDDKKKSYCELALDKAEDQKKATEQEVSDYLKSISDVRGRLETVSEEIEGFKGSVEDLDKQVDEQTKMRKEESAQYNEDAASSNAAMKLLDTAKNRLKKFYAPSGAKLVQVHEVTQDSDDEYDDVDSEDDSSADSFAQTNMESGDASDEEQPKGPDLTAKKQGSGGVLGMIDTLMQDLRLQKQEADMEETQAQKDYEAFIDEAKGKRAEDSKSLDDREGAKSELEASLQKVKSALKSANANLGETKEELMGLHGECDFILKYYDTKKEARQSEMEALGKAAAVLSGAKMD